jgi:hypothetical protein
MRFFNTAGPVDSLRHYCIPPLGRLELDEVLMLIDRHKYFVLHAPRQSGKTTYLLALRDHLTAAARLRCVYYSVEVGQSAREDVPEAMRVILSQLGHWSDPANELLFSSASFWEIAITPGRHWFSLRLLMDSRLVGLSVLQVPTGIRG